MPDTGQNFGTAYVELRLSTDKMKSDFDKAKTDVKKSAITIEDTFKKAKLKFDTDFAKMKLKDLQGEAKKLRAEFERKKINPNISVASLDLTKQKLEKVVGALRTAGMASEDVGQKVNWLGRSMERMFARIGVLYALKKAFDFGKAIINAAADFEALRTRLTSLYGSAEKASDVFNQFKQIAATTPYSLKGVVEAGATIKAFGMDAEKTLKPVTDLAAFMGVDVVEAASAVGRAFAGGVGAADVLRERGVLNLIKSFKGVTDLTKLTLPEFRKALIEAMQDPAAGIAGSTTRLSKTFSGAVSNMGDAIENFAATIGTKMLPFLNGLVHGITSLTTAITPTNSALEETKRKASEQAAKFDLLTSRYITLRENTNKTKAEQKLYIGTINDLQRLYPNYLKNINLQADSLDKVRIAFMDARTELNNYLQDLIKLAIIDKNKDQFVNLGVSIAEATTRLTDLKSESDRLSKGIPGTGRQLVLRLTGESDKEYAKRLKDFTDNAIKVQQEKIKKLSEQQKQIEDVINKTTDTLTGGSAPTNSSSGTDNNTVTDNKPILDAQKKYYDQVKFLDSNYSKFLTEQNQKEVADLKKVLGDKFNEKLFWTQKEKQLAKDYADWLRSYLKDKTGGQDLLNSGGGLTANAPLPESMKSSGIPKTLKGVQQPDKPPLYTQKQLDQQQREWEDNNHFLVSSLQDSMNIIQGNFHSLWQGVFGEANSVFEQIAEMIATKLAMSGISSLIGLIFGGAATVATGGAAAPAVAAGGLVSFAAMGGSVMAGTPYIVGEKGQELFIPNTSGYIIPNNQLNNATGNNSGIEKRLDNLTQNFRMFRMNMLENSLNGKNKINVSVNGNIDNNVIRLANDKSNKQYRRTS